MNTGAPYRPPCDGWFREWYTGGCFQHWRNSEANLLKWENTTTVGNYVCPQVPLRIRPYPRPGSEDAPTECVGGLPPIPDDPRWCDGGARTLPPCGEWSRKEFLRLCPSGQQRIDVNCYDPRPGQVRNVTRCQKVGFKNVQSRKVWHGRYAFNQQPDEGCSGVAVPASAPTTKYLTVTRSGWWKQEVGTSYVNYATFTGTFTVDRYSGVVTLSSCSYEHWHEVDGVKTPSPATLDALRLVMAFGNGNGMCEATFDSWVAANAVTEPGDYFNHDSFASSSTSFWAERRVTILPAPYNEFESWEFSVSLSNPYTASDWVADLVYLSGFWDLARDDYYPWRRDRLTTVAPLVTYDEVPSPVNPDMIASIDATDELPNPCANFKDTNRYDPDDPDCFSGYTGDILGKPFTLGLPYAYETAEDQEYSWQQPVAGEPSPYVIPHRGPINIVVQRWQADGAHEYTILACTGVLGTDYTLSTDAYGWVTIHVVENECLEDVTGGSWPDRLVVTYDWEWEYGGHFDFRRVDRLWEYIGGDWYYSDRFGAWSGKATTHGPANGAVPYTCTQWTSAEDAASFPHGAWLISNANTGVARLQKYAEIKLPWRSQNWFGPAGKFRDMKYNYTCGGIPDCARSGGTSAWPSAWPIEGDRFFTATEDAGTVTVVLDRPAEFLRASDTIQFTDDAGASVGSPISVASVETGGGSFTYSGSLPAGTATRVKSSGAPGYWWYDTDGKGDYSIIKHTYDHRTYALAHSGDPDPGTMNLTRDCLQFSPCWPAVMCFSPNYNSGLDPGASQDDFRLKNGNTIAFGVSDVVLDQRYGMQWQAFYKQVMVDYRYMISGLGFLAPEPCKLDAPETSCTPDNWEQDDGSCSTTGSAGWPWYPWVECRESIPSAWDPFSQGGGEPTPSAWYDAVTSYNPLSAVGPSAHITEPNAPDIELSPWTVWLKMQDCICANGQWAEDGELVDCPDYYYSGYKSILGTWWCASDLSTGEGAAQTPAVPLASTTTTTADETGTTTDHY